MNPAPDPYDDANPFFVKKARYCAQEPRRALYEREPLG
jgi:hypothetical protein